MSTTTYVNKGLAGAAAKRKGLTDYKIVQAGVVWAIRDMTSPLYNGDLRERSIVEGAVGVVWAICKDMLSDGASRKEILNACIDAGVNAGTARTQYQAYRKAQGLVKS